MKLTVVTATFNVIKSGNRESLIRCVESVAALKTPYEHLIFDGASTDGTSALLTELAARVPGLYVWSAPDAGVYNALNKGVKAASGEWFYVLGCDDHIIDPTEFDKLVAEVGANTSVIVAPTVRDTPSHLYRKLSDLKIMFRRFPYSHQSVIMRTALVRTIGGFDERYRLSADWAMLMTCYRRKEKFWYTEVPITYYAAGGLSERESCARQEQISVYADFWGLTGWRKSLYAAAGYVPLSKIVRLFGSQDEIVRMAAHYAVRLWVKAVLRMLLWPFVIVRRRLRYGVQNAI